MDETARNLPVLRLESPAELATSEDALELVAGHARRAPEQPALRIAGQSVSYPELWSATQALSLRLAHSGSDAFRPVAILLDRLDARLFAAILAVVHSGRFFVVIDPHYPAARNRLVLEDADASLVLHDTDDAQWTGLVQAMRLPPMAELVDEGTDLDAPLVPCSDDDLACLVYTSGSTGKPKGVMVPRGALLQIARIQGSHIGIRESSRMSMLSSASVFGGMRTIWGGLTAGATILPFAVEQEGLDGFGEWLRTERIEILHCTPSVLRHFARLESSTGRSDSVRTVIFGADRVLAEDIALAREVFSPDVRVWTGLGASETGTVSGRLVNAREELPEGQMPLGPPVPGREVLLAGEDGRAVPAGETGELIVQGRALALGYWRMPERTAEVFSNARETGTRSFRTGDLARVMPDGSLLHMGRRDFVVKIRGVRVDLGEVEAVLTRHGSVRECAVRAFDEIDGEKMLVAFVQFRGDQSTDELREYICGLLPAAMQPQRYVVVQDWPRTASGKLDRKALQPPPPEQGVAIRDLQGDMEERVALAWSTVLGKTVIHRDAHFLEAGGNSLSAMRVVARLSAELHRRLSLAMLLRAPRLRDFAAQVAASEPQSEGGTEGPSSLALEGPLSPAQQALWLLERLEGESATYNISLALRLTGPVDVDRLSRAISALRARHEVLRTEIHEADGKVVQRILAPVDHAAPPTSELVLERVLDAPTLQTALEEEIRRPVSADNGPLWRVRLISHGEHDHRLVLVLHHIICDGWSLQILGEDLGALYSGRGAALPRVEGRSMDVASEQWKRAQCGEDRPSRDYWARTLEGIGTLALPTDRRPGARVATTGRIHRFVLPEALQAAARRIAAAESTTPFVVHLAVFRTLLARYSGTSDFGIGLPAAARPAARLERVVGYFVNMLVARTPLTPDMTFRGLVQASRETVVEALAHEDIAFEQVVEAVAPARDGTRNPLFQVAFAVQNQPRGRIAFDGLEHAICPAHSGASKFDLTLEISSDEVGWGEFEYRTELFDDTTIERLADSFVELLSAAVAAPDGCALALPMLGAAQQRRLVDEWNATDVGRAPGERMDDLVLATCVRHADAVALVADGASLSYRELGERVEAMARKLSLMGLARGEPVGLELHRSIELIVASLAILRAGGIYVPLDPGWPERRKQAVMDTAGLRLVIRDGSIGLNGDVALRPMEPDAADLAYILFTSGSTGEPKGVEISHASLCNHHRWFVDCVEMNAADVMLFRTSPTFDISLIEMFAPLLVGARIVIARSEAEVDPGYMTELVRRHGVTIHQATPSAYRLLLASADFARCDSIRWLACGGEAMDRELSRALRHSLPSARLGNFYGPTEVTIWATFQEITDDASPVVPIGRPIANTRCYVLDGQGQLLPVGAWGELHLGGAGVARGYRGRPDLTAERFLPDPFRAGGRIYRTGDRARWRADGTLELAGRLDSQVKIRGYRIEIGEVESALAAAPDVAQAAVVVPRGVGGDLLAAFVVARDGTDLDARAVRDALAERLPAYMIPQRVEIRSHLPLLSSGKVDRATLTREAETTATNGRTTSPACSPLEEALIGLWREVLGQAEVGPDQDFFALGGHSLLAFQLATRIQQRLGKPVTLRMVFSHPTVRSLAQAMGNSARERQGRLVITLQEGGSRPPVYCICGIQLYRELAQALGPDVPVHGVFLPWEEELLQQGLRDTDISIEQLAGRYVEAIRSEQPSGVFCLLGVSFGGILAYEMARQLAARGEPVPLVTILDVPPPEAHRSLRRRLGRLKKQLLAPWRRKVASRREAHRASDAPPEHLEDLRRGLYLRAMDAYRTQPYTGRMLVVRASKRLPVGIGADPALGWRLFADSVETIDAAGDHLGILRGNGAATVASALLDRLP